jgi:tRNA(adenine34) deaminase
MTEPSDMDNVFMARAIQLSLENVRSGRGGPFGCVVVKDGDIVAEGANRVTATNDPTAHAEMLAIRQAAAAVGSERLVDCDLFVTLEPCTMCAGALSFARIRRLYYGAADPKGGAVESGVRFFSSPTCHHRPDLYGGIGEQEAAALLRGFFAERR